ncbi:Hypothetical protein R9X50_00144100 [Acrodontium crateriforme]|uniref:Uncharacterized protein n=1 Tax=Acrodontium crateriforme TaxID=150365 RepID=A0AAQ3R5U2_9PEZI|nr:Hypothetical protein R9X50_00144100 [Acrodontium crateriforme]
MAIQANDYTLISLMIILGCGCGFMMLWGMFRFYNAESVERSYEPTKEQAIYMREARIRSLRNLAASLGRKDVVRDLDDSIERGNAHGEKDEKSHAAYRNSEHSDHSGLY